MLYDCSPTTEKGSSIAKNLIQNAIISPETVAVIGSTRVSNANSHRIKIYDAQIENFILGTPSELDSRTMGYGMVFLHELTHTVLGGNMKDPDSKDSYLPGETIEFMNRIREELDKANNGVQHKTYGKRLSHLGTIENGIVYLPFQDHNNNKYHITYKYNK